MDSDMTGRGPGGRWHSDRNDGYRMATMVDGRQMQHEAAAASTLWAFRASSRRALQQLVCEAAPRTTGDRVTGSRADSFLPIPLKRWRERGPRWLWLVLERGAPSF